MTTPATTHAYPASAGSAAESCSFPRRELGGIPAPFVSGEGSSPETSMTVQGRGPVVFSPRRVVPLLGPAFVAAVAYVDPGNVATNFSAGASYGYRLLWVVVAANLMAMLVQLLTATSDRPRPGHPVPRTAAQAGGAVDVAPGQVRRHGHRPRRDRRRRRCVASSVRYTAHPRRGHHRSRSLPRFAVRVVAAPEARASHRHDATRHRSWIRVHRVPHRARPRFRGQRLGTVLRRGRRASGDVHLTEVTCTMRASV